MKAAIGMLEIKSIARGILVADEMLKAANVELLQSMPICPGKYIALISGDVGAVKSALGAGKAMAAEQLIDEFVLPNVHKAVLPALSGTTHIDKIRSLGIIETFTVASGIVAADVAVKAANVDLLEVRLAHGMGGKSLVLLTGEVSAVQASVESAVARIKEDGVYAGAEFIASPHKDLLTAIN
ncbi:BMC domain-containing protein [Paradesulfitobacterium aromaticivorans]